MRRLLAFFLAVVCLWGGLWWAAQGVSSSRQHTAALLAPDEKHYVTPAMLAASGTRGGQVARPFTAKGHDGSLVRLHELTRSGPVAIVFIKAGCPCNPEAEPHFQRLYQLYKDHARFVGVIDGDEAEAARYARAHCVAYPVLADPELHITRDFKAENGAYVALVTVDGVIDTLWPGYSADMMQELSERLAVRAGVPAARIDTRGLPTAYTTGCPFQKQE